MHLPNIIHKSSHAVLLWIAEVVLGVISTGLSDFIVNVANSFVNQDFYNLYVGIIGIVALVSFALIALILVLYYTKYLRIKYRETTLDVYNKKSGLELDEFLKKAKKEIDIFGITLEETTGSFISVIENKIGSKDFSKIRVMLYDQEDTQMTGKINQLVDSDIGTVGASLNRFKSLQVGKNGNKLELKVFNGIPIQSMFILDPKSDSNGIMRVEPYLFGIRKDDRRIYEISTTNQKQLFETNVESYNKIWDSAHPP